MFRVRGVDRGYDGNSEHRVHGFWVWHECMNSERESFILRSSFPWVFGGFRRDWLELTYGTRVIGFRRQKRTVPMLKVSLQTPLLRS